MRVGCSVVMLHATAMGALSPNISSSPGKPVMAKVLLSHNVGNNRVVVLQLDRVATGAPVTTLQLSGDTATDNDWSNDIVRHVLDNLSASHYVVVARNSRLFAQGPRILHVDVYAFNAPPPPIQTAADLKHLFISSAPRYSLLLTDATRSMAITRVFHNAPRFLGMLAGVTPIVVPEKFNVENGINGFTSNVVLEIVPFFLTARGHTLKARESSLRSFFGVSGFLMSLATAPKMKSVLGDVRGMAKRYDIKDYEKYLKENNDDDEDVCAIYFFNDKIFVHKTKGYPNAISIYLFEPPWPGHSTFEPLPCKGNVPVCIFCDKKERMQDLMKIPSPSRILECEDFNPAEHAEGIIQYVNSQAIRSLSITTTRKVAPMPGLIAERFRDACPELKSMRIAYQGEDNVETESQQFRLSSTISLEEHAFTFTPSADTSPQIAIKTITHLRIPVDLSFLLAHQNIASAISQCEKVNAITFIIGDRYAPENIAVSQDYDCELLIVNIGKTCQKDLFRFHKDNLSKKRIVVECYTKRHHAPSTPGVDFRLACLFHSTLASLFDAKQQNNSIEVLYDINDNIITAGSLDAPSVTETQQLLKEAGRYFLPQYDVKNGVVGFGKSLCIELICRLNKSKKSKDTDSEEGQLKKIKCLVEAIGEPAKNVYWQIFIFDYFSKDCDANAEKKGEEER